MENQYLTAMRFKRIMSDPRAVGVLLSIAKRGNCDVESLLLELDIPRDEYSSFFFVIEELEKGRFIKINPHGRVLNQVYTLDFSGKLFVEHLRISEPAVRRMIKKVDLAIS